MAVAHTREHSCSGLGCSRPHVLFPPSAPTGQHTEKTQLRKDTAGLTAILLEWLQGGKKAQPFPLSLWCAMKPPAPSRDRGTSAAKGFSDRPRNTKLSLMLPHAEITVSYLLDARRPRRAGFNNSGAVGMGVNQFGGS